MTRRTAVGTRRTAVGLLLAGVLVGAPRFVAAERWYGFGAGVGTTLAPTDHPGVWLTASATVAPPPTIGSRRITRARGTVAGFIARGSWAVLPLLSGDVGLRLGPLELFATGGVQIFGGARRDGWTVFATFGLLGGGGLALELSENLQLGLRAQLTWLPTDTTAKISSPAEQEAAKPRFFFVSGALTLALRHELLAGGGASPSADDDFGW